MTSAITETFEERHTVLLPPLRQLLAYTSSGIDRRTVRPARLGVR